jgi:hypothetical protein
MSGACAGAGGIKRRAATSDVAAREDVGEERPPAGRGGGRPVAGLSSAGARCWRAP